MPGHIFVQLGQWREAAAACEAGWEASLRWVAQRKLPRSSADFHSLGWLAPIYIQLGQRARARQALRTYAEGMARDGAGGAPSYVEAAVAVARDSGRWPELDELLAPADAALAALDTAFASKRAAAHGEDVRPTPALTRAALAAARATAAARRGDVPLARKGLDECKAQEQRAAQLAPRRYDEPERMEARAAELRLSAEIEAAQGHAAAAEAALRKAADLEDTLAQTDGAHPSAMSSYERLGALLLARDQPAQALTALSAAAQRTPGRAALLLLLARAAARVNDPSRAAEHYRALAHLWEQADADAPDLAEVRARAQP